MTSSEMPDRRPEAAAAEPCPICGGVGFVRLKVPVGHPLFGKAVPCRCKREEFRQRRLERLLKLGNLQSYRGMTFDSFQTAPVTDAKTSVALTEELRFDLETARAYAEDPKGWLVFTGSYGTGKTHLAAAIANYRVEHGYPVLFVSVPDLLDHLRASYGPESPVSYDEHFEQVRTIDLLVLDDLGTQNTTPWAAEKLYQLLNYRYASRLPTVITTNQLIEDMDPRLGSRLRDHEVVTVLQMHGPDFRARAGEVIGRDAGALDGFKPNAELTFELFSDRHGEIDPTQSSELRKIRRILEAYANAEFPIDWILLRGATGVGKTHLAAAVANRAISSGVPAVFVRAPDLLDHLRATFQPGSSVSYDQRFRDVRRARLLVLDDLGAQSATPWAEEKLFQILDHRYVSHLPTVVTMTDDGWNHLNERLRSRFLDATRCLIIDIHVPSYRGKPSETTKAPRHSTRRRV